MEEKSKYHPTLVENLFGDAKKIPTRDGFGEGLVELGSKDPDVVALCADLTHSTKVNLFKEKFPERFFGVGIAEANMVGIASGLSTAGKIPFVATFGVFAAGRVWDQLRMSVCYPNANVKIVATHCGIFSVGGDGASHQAIEDISLTRVLPNMTVITPCDFVEAKKATIAAAKIYGPVYLRFTREKLPVITTEETPFEIGRGEIFREGNDVTIVACGSMVYDALLAARELEQEGIDARVINNHSIKPMDEKILIKAARETGALVTAEEHQLFGGMGSAVSEIIVQQYSVPVKMVGVMDEFGESGDVRGLKEKFNLTDKSIVDAVKFVLKNKK